MSNLGVFGSYKISNLENRSYRCFLDCFNNVAEPTLDQSAILQFVAKGYFFAKRTVISEISKRTAPFFCEDEDSLRLSVTPIRQSPSSIAEHLESMLLTELIQNLTAAKEIALPLSGGMDSRIVAAGLVRLRERGKLKGRIKAYTWGTVDSRDVIYASKIAEILELEWQHLNITADLLESNVRLATNFGLEFSPLHLHAVDPLRFAISADSVVVSSFGDSIGRGRYSGRHVSKLPGLDSFSDRYSIITSSVKEGLKAQFYEDARFLHSKLSFLSKTTRTEIDYQAHYMHRMINPVWSEINNKTKVYQAFTSGAMWKWMISLDVNARSDEPYYKLLMSLNPKLLEIPWSATGKRYFEHSTRGAIVDTNTHFVAPYGRWVREDLIHNLSAEILNGPLTNLSVFDSISLKRLLTLTKSDQNVEANYKTELVLWLAALSIFLRTNGRRVVEPVNFKGNVAYQKLDAAISTNVYENFRRVGLKTKSIMRFWRGLFD